MQVIDFSLNCFDELADLLEVSDELLMFAQEIWVCMNIEQYEHISDTKSGTVTLKQILFDRNINVKDLENLINDEISNNTSGSSLFKYEVKVNITRGSVRDIILVDTIIYDDNDEMFSQRFIYQ